MHPLIYFSYIILAAMLLMLFRVLVLAVRRDFPLGRVEALPISPLEMAIAVLLLTATLYASPATLLSGFNFVVLELAVALFLLRKHPVAIQKVTVIPARPWLLAGVALWLALAMHTPISLLSTLNVWLVQILNLPGEGQSLADILLNSNDLWLIGRVLVWILLTAPAAEELYFRGVVQPALRQWLSPWSSVIATGILFAFIHFSPSDFLPLAFFGIAMGVLYERYGSIPLNMLTHSMFNATVAAYVLLQRFFGPLHPSLSGMHIGNHAGSL